MIALAILSPLMVMLAVVMVGGLRAHGRRLDDLEARPTWTPVEPLVNLGPKRQHGTEPCSDVHPGSTHLSWLHQRPADRPAREKAIPVLDVGSGIELRQWRDKLLEREHVELSIPEEFLRRMSASQVRQDLLFRLNTWLDEVTR